MGQATLDRTLELVRQLSPSELHEVERAVRNMLGTAHDTSESERLDAALIAAGLVAGMPSKSGSELRDRILVPITGAPLSQTVVEDRR